MSNIEHLKKLIASSPMDMLGKKKEVAKKMSKAELRAKYVARHGGEKKLHEIAEQQRARMASHKGSSIKTDSEKMEFQRKTGRAYND